MNEDEQGESRRRDEVGDVVRRPDGRAVGFAEWGDREGRPVVMAHGGLGSRLVASWFDEAARDGGAHLIIIERPGFGLSDPAPSAPMIEWSEDVAAVLDALEIDPFDLLGFSAGGAYALAVATAMADRVGAVTLVSGEGFVHEPDHLATVSVGSRALAAIGAQAPALFVPIAAAFVALARWSVDDSLESDPLFEEATRHRYAGLIRDTVVGTRPWGFIPTDVSVPVRLWHGTDDGEVPLAHAEANARILPESTLHVCEGEGHFLSAETWQQVLDGESP